MKKFTLIIIAMLFIGSVSTLISFRMIIDGIENQLVYNRVYTIGVVSAIITFISIILVFVRVIILIAMHGSLTVK